VAADQPAHVEQQQARALLDRVLATLEPAKREVFVLFEIEKLSMEEVAAAVGCPPRTAYYRLETARKEFLRAWERANARSDVR